MTASADLCVRAGYEVVALAALIDLNLVADFRWRDLALRAAVIPIDAMLRIFRGRSW